MTDLDKLIGAVEAGKFPSHDTMGILRYGEEESAINAYHGSLDAALELFKEILPDDSHWYLDDGGGQEQPFARVYDTAGRFDIQSDEETEFPARALLLAVLKAYRSVTQ